MNEHKSSKQQRDQADTVHDWLRAMERWFSYSGEWTDNDNLMAEMIRKRFALETTKPHWIDDVLTNLEVLSNAKGKSWAIAESMLLNLVNGGPSVNRTAL